MFAKPEKSMAKLVLMVRAIEQDHHRKEDLDHSDPTRYSVHDKSNLCNRIFTTHYHIYIACSYWLHNQNRVLEWEYGEITIPIVADHNICTVAWSWVVNCRSEGCVLPKKNSVPAECNCNFSDVRMGIDECH